MKLNIKQLNFDLPDNAMTSYCQEMASHTEKIRELAKRSGTGSDRFKLAFRRFLGVLELGENVADSLKEPIDVRALAVALKTSAASGIRLDDRLFRKIDSLRERPSSLLVESIFSHYLNKYDQLDDLKAVEAWLRKSKENRRGLDDNTSHILSGQGPKWLAESSHERQVDFEVRVEQVGLGNYMSGRFLATAKNIYYLETLRNLKSGENHEILHEVQKPAVYESRYTENSLLGHEVLKILISKTDTSQISDHWMNVIMAIAGDPRVSTRNDRYIRWWLQISPDLIAKVHGWLSKLDLKLFLKALKDFSDQPGKDELRRMYPSRKRFLEGLLEQELVTGTRLFLTYEAEGYVKRYYKTEHLPSYSMVEGSGAKPLIHVSLSGVHIVEGTHSCKFWVYEKLADSAAVFNYNKSRFTYRDLTAGLNERMIVEQNEGCCAAIQHSGQWQVKAAIALKEAGVDIDASTLLTPADYQTYKYSGYL